MTDTPESTRERDEWWTDRDRTVTFLTLLEGRRSAIEQAQWQAPTLTIAAQAFLLTTLTDKDADDRALFWILVAGIAACVAAILALVRLRAREVQYSEAVSDLCEKTKLPDPRPFMLGAKPVPLRWFNRPVDRPIRAIGKWRVYPTVYLYWVAALALFIVADVVAYCSST